MFWRRFNTAGAVSGLGVGLLVLDRLIVISPSIMGIDAPTVAAPARHLIQRRRSSRSRIPGIVSIPLGFLAAWIGTLLSREPKAEAMFTELIVRANTGLGAEKAVAH